MIACKTALDAAIQVACFCALRESCKSVYQVWHDVIVKHRILKSEIPWAGTQRTQGLTIKFFAQDKQKATGSLRPCQDLFSLSAARFAMEESSNA